MRWLLGGSMLLCTSFNVACFVACGFPTQVGFNPSRSVRFVVGPRRHRSRSSQWNSLQRGSPWRRPSPFSLVTLSCTAGLMQNTVDFYFPSWKSMLTLNPQRTQEPKYPFVPPPPPPPLQDRRVHPNCSSPRLQFGFVLVCSVRSGVELFALELFLQRRRQQNCGCTVDLLTKACVWFKWKLCSLLLVLVKVKILRLLFHLPFKFRIKDLGFANDTVPWKAAGGLTSEYDEC